MDIDLILKELKKDGWWLENHFYNESKDFLQAIVNETEKQLMLGGVVGRSEQLRAFKQFLQSEYNLPISNRMVDEFEQKQSS